MTKQNDQAYEEEMRQLVDQHLGAGKRSASEGELLFHTKLAQQSLASKTKNKQISFRIAESDLIKLKAMAVEKGIPYQTYLTALIHEHTHGVLSKSE